MQLLDTPSPLSLSTEIKERRLFGTRIHCWSDLLLRPNKTKACYHLSLSLSQFLVVSKESTHKNHKGKKAPKDHSNNNGILSLHPLIIPILLLHLPFPFSSQNPR
ncbi:hypothetical protein L1887_16277 [Cichorium endivia]|nr:hypothetical protein L1887_16277 [Cichorium endivia]